MSRVSSDLQVTIPPEVAERSGIAPGDEVVFVPERDALRVVRVAPAVPSTPDVPEQRHALRRMFARFHEHRRLNPTPPRPPESGRGWTREELYEERTGWWPR